MRTEVDAEYVRGTPLWIAELSNGLMVYQDDSQGNSWLELKNYIDGLKINDDFLLGGMKPVTVTKLCLRFRDHWEGLPGDKDGYFCVRSVMGNPFGYTQHFLRTGYLEKDRVYITEWILPELMEFVKEDYPADHAFIEECLIRNK